MLIAISLSSFYNLKCLSLLESFGFEARLNTYKRGLKGEEIVHFCSGAVGLIAGTEKLNKEILGKVPTLRVISRCGIGLDNIDLVAAERLGIKVYNTPDAPTNAVAELTLGLILDCLRNISSSDRSIRSGKWNTPMGELRGEKTVGIVGFGRIGRAVSRLAMAFGTRVLAFDIARKEEGGVNFVSFEELLSRADVVTLHLSYDPERGQIITAGAIDKMRDESYLINTSRGKLVDENALYEALKSGKLAGAALDVFESEPYNGDLIALENVILTPHMGSNARETRIEMEKQAVENLLKGLKEVGVT